MQEIERQWKLLRLIPINKHNRRTTYDLWQLLLAQVDYSDITKRTIERDLAFLQTIFPLEKKIEGRTHYWYWQCNVNLWLPNLSRNFGNLGEIDELQRLLKPLGHDGRLGKLIERGFVGRQWVLDGIETWRVSSTQRVYWLVADPGMGKSAIAARLVHGADRYTVAYHFCHFNEPETCRPEAFVRSLAFQLAICLPNYRQRLINTAKYAIKPLEEMHADDLFTLLLSDPLRHAGDEGQSTNRKLIVVDALDDAPMIADILVRRHEELPDWIALLLTSRPHTQFGGALKHTLANDDSRNLSDLEAYLEQWLSSLKPPPPVEAHEQLLRRSEGNILYLATAREGVKAGIFRLDDLGSYPAGLGALYKAWFDRYFSNEVDWEGTLSYQLLELVCASPEPLPLSLARRILEWKGRDQIKATLPLGSLIHNDEGVVELFHRSLSDWLQDVDHAKTYWINAEDGRIKLATAVWSNLSDTLSAKVPTYAHRVLPVLLLSTPQERRKEVWGDDKQHPMKLSELYELFPRKTSGDGIEASALALAKLVVQENSNVYGLLDERTLDSMINLSWELRIVKEKLPEQEELDTARNLLEHVLETREIRLGVTHPKTISSLVELAGYWEVEGGIRERAYPLRSKALHAFISTFGEFSPEAFQARLKLARLLCKLGDYEEALNITKELPFLLNPSLKLGKVYVSLMNISGLVRMLEIDIFNVLEDNANYSSAIQILEQLIAIEDYLVGVDHRPTLRTRQNLAVRLRNAGKLDKAEPIQRDALARFIKIHGDNSLEITYPLSALGLLLTKKGEFTEAIEHLEKAFAIRERELGTDHEQTVKVRDRLAAARAAIASAPPDQAGISNGVVETNPAEGPIKMADTATIK